MSGGTPYGTNGYTNTNATNSTFSSRYGQLYNQQANSSAGSVSSYASRDRRRRDDQPPNIYPVEEIPNPRYGQQHNASGEYNSRPSTSSKENSDYNDMRRDRRGFASNPNSAINGYRPFSPRRGPAISKPMEETLSHIRLNWQDMSGDDCVPVQVALKLMDPSSLGLADKESDFQQTHVDLQRTLKTIVNEHHQDFNSSIGTYHKIQASIQASQSRVRYLKQSLATAQSGLLTTKPELKGLATSSQELDDTLQLLTQIESIQTVPERLEAQISEKRFLAAVELFQEATDIVRKPELDGIGAVADLRSYFISQETSLTEILVEELHDHLYLKSPYCQDRWRANSLEGADKDNAGTVPALVVNTWDKPVYHYLAGLDTKTAMRDDPSRNPEADTFYYIHMIVEALYKLGQLKETVARIEQRMPVEMYKVVEKTNADVDVRHKHLRGQVNKATQLNIPTMTDHKQSVVLSDLLWTLYAKFEAIAEGHRVLHEVIVGVVEREQLSPRDKYLGSFKELWKLYQLEMRSLLHDYLAPGGDSTTRSGIASNSSGDVFGRVQRDKTKKMFKLSEMDSKSGDLADEHEQLDEILKTSVPGLISKTRNAAGTFASTDRSVADSSAAGHKLLVQPTVFNMTYLLPPSLSFLQRLRDIVPVGANIAMSTLTSFLDDFLINIFHPQLEEAITEVCAQCFIDLDAFMQDPQWSRLSPLPIFRGTVSFMDLIRAFSDMVSAIPRDQIFTQLIITQLVNYYDKCYGFYKTIVSRLTESLITPTKSVRTLRAAAAFAENGEMRSVASSLLQGSSQSTPEAFRLVNEEVQLLLAATKSAALSPYDIISDPRSIQNLTLVYNSMQWLCSSLTQLRLVEHSTSNSSKGHSRDLSHSRRWTLVSSLNTVSQSRSTKAIHLPLTSESVVAFDQTLSSFGELAQTALITLHMDIRCRIIHRLERNMNTTQDTALKSVLPIPEGGDSQSPSTESGAFQWVLFSAPASASPLVLELNHELISFETDVSSYLGPRERSFITNGLNLLVDRICVVGADWIKVMNSFGAQRMQIDGLVLQQNLRNITIESPPPQQTTNTTGLEAYKSSNLPIATLNNSNDSLTASHQYYDLFLQGPDKIITWLKDKKRAASRSPSRRPTTVSDPNPLESTIGYTYDELRTLLELCYSVPLRSTKPEDGVKAKRALGDKLMVLGELMWDSDLTLTKTTSNSSTRGLAPSVTVSSTATGSGPNSIRAGEGGVGAATGTSINAGGEVRNGPAAAAAAAAAAASAAQLNGPGPGLRTPGGGVTPRTRSGDRSTPGVEQREVFFDAS